MRQHEAGSTPSRTRKRHALGICKLGSADALCEISECLGMEPFRSGPASAPSIAPRPSRSISHVQLGVKDTDRAESDAHMAVTALNHDADSNKDPSFTTEGALQENFGKSCITPSKADFSESKVAKFEFTSRDRKSHLTPLSETFTPKALSDALPNQSDGIEIPDDLSDGQFSSPESFCPKSLLRTSPSLILNPSSSPTSTCGIPDPSPFPSSTSPNPDPPSSLISACLVLDQSSSPRNTSLIHSQPQSPTSPFLIPDPSPSFSGTSLIPTPSPSLGSASLILNPGASPDKASLIIHPSPSASRTCLTPNQSLSSRSPSHLENSPKLPLVVESSPTCLDPLPLARSTRDEQLDLDSSSFAKLCSSHPASSKFRNSMAPAQTLFSQSCKLTSEGSSKKIRSQLEYPNDTRKQSSLTMDAQSGPQYSVRGSLPLSRSVSSSSSQPRNTQRGPLRLRQPLMFTPMQSLPNTSTSISPNVDLLSPDSQLPQSDSPEYQSQRSYSPTLASRRSYPITSPESRPISSLSEQSLQSAAHTPYAIPMSASFISNQKLMSRFFLIAREKVSPALDSISLTNREFFTCDERSLNLGDDSAISAVSNLASPASHSDPEQPKRILYEVRQTPPRSPALPLETSAIQQSTQNNMNEWPVVRDKTLKSPSSASRSELLHSSTGNLFQSEIRNESVMESVGSPAVAENSSGDAESWWARGFRRMQESVQEILSAAVGEGSGIRPVLDSEHTTLQDCERKNQLEDRRKFLVKDGDYRSAFLRGFVEAAVEESESTLDWGFLEIPSEFLADLPTSRSTAIVTQPMDSTRTTDPPSECAADSLDGTPSSVTVPLSLSPLSRLDEDSSPSRQNISQAATVPQGETTLPTTMEFMSRYALLSAAKAQGMPKRRLAALFHQQKIEMLDEDTDISQRVMDSVSTHMRYFGGVQSCTEHENDQSNILPKADVFVKLDEWKSAQAVDVQHHMPYFADDPVWTITVGVEAHGLNENILRFLRKKLESLI
eukprot:Gregarina_sp_Poly_1__7276@NODE_39_length_18147_cov_101_572069_g34_i0_p1_GENE_NODE_39_length_18147_cov_101_572069_g34_i0NODE_39_length_18147_cov_101_572069_g34_i0_p1_ORF_typecomplete_len1004_score126_51_NODE_39_length_18147_cov_101_572069_g34_i01184014851